MAEIDYSVIVPVYNSSETLEELFTRIQKCFNSLCKSFEIIFVDDGSRDDSWKLISEIKKQFPEQVKAIRFVRNFGQHNAIFCGISHANGKFFITIDDDLQHPPEEIPKLIEKYKETSSDLVYGYFKKKHHSFLQNFGSKLIKKSAKVMYDSKGEGSSFRLITNQLGKQLLEHSQNFVFIDELLLWYTGDISFVKVEHEKRKSGNSGYSKIKLLKLSINLMLYYTAIPLKLMIYGGFFAAFFSFFLGIYFILKKIFYNVPHGYTSIIVTILFSTGIIIFSLGIIGEYLIRIYMVQNKKPPYAIKQKLL
ncbi:MAG: glycosyltransferase family 2 protein [Bacteroidetes bacterium]|nr:glycosyltransferase family 2 protein [Bacteroidota bacterium]